jgi:predicted AAA+ superfamily ATPase
MMFKQLIRDGQNMLKSASFLQRVYTFPMDLLQLQKIISFIGARRVGKSTIMKQVIHQLIEQKSIILEQVIWVDGNEIDPMNFDIQKVLESFFSLYPDLIPFVVIDEVHELPDRVRQVFVVYNK